MPSLQCPRCSNIVTVAQGQSPVCTRCGFGSSTTPTAAPTAAAYPAYPAYAQPAQPYGAYSTPSYPGQPNPYAYGQYPQRRNDGMAIASLVLGIVAFFPLYIIGILPGGMAIIFGVISRNRIQQNPSLQGGGMAMAGIILGSIMVVLWVLIMLLIGFAFSRLGRFA